MLSARAVNWLPFPVALKMSTLFFPFGFFFKLHIFIYFILYRTFAEVMNPQLLLHLWFKMGTLCVIWQARDHWNIPIQIQTQDFQFKGGFLCNYNKNELLLSPNDSMKVSFCVVVPLPREDERGSSAMAQLQPYATSSTQFSPVHFDHPGPSHSEADDVASHC